MVKMMANATVLKYGISVGTEDNVIDCDKKDEVHSEQALVDAAGAGDFERVRELLECGVSVDADEFNKLLFYASKNYVTPLQIAAANGHDKCVQILIDHGADVNAKDRFDVTALHMAAEKGHYLCVKALLDASADCCVPTKFSKSGCYTAVPHLGGTTPLHLAAANNHIDCVKELIQYGADYNAVDECGRTSLYIAAQAGFDACVLAHLKNAVGKDILSLPSLETSDTPLHFAVSRGMVDCVKELLSLGSDVNHINHLGCSPLHLALTPSNEKASVKMQILKLLILEGYNTDINRVDAAGFTPLHYVCFNGYRSLWCRRPEMAKFLIAYGADVNIKSNRGTTLLECELRSHEKNFSFLRFIVKSMLHLPRLKSLNVRAHTEGRPPLVGPVAMRPIENEAAAAIYRHFPDIPEAIARGQQHIDLNMFVDLNHAFQQHPVIRPERPQQPIIQYVRQHPRHCVRPPLLLHVYDALEGIIDDRNLLDNENEVEANQHWDSPFVLKRQIWYERMASNPRTLQHHCRYVIRNFMGPSKLKHIRRLPIPSSLQSYLLLEYDS